MDPGNRWYSEYWDRAPRRVQVRITNDALPSAAVPIGNIIEALRYVAFRALALRRGARGKMPDFRLTTARHVPRITFADPRAAIRHASFFLRTQLAAQWMTAAETVSPDVNDTAASNKVVRACSYDRDIDHVHVVYVDIARVGPLVFSAAIGIYRKSCTSH